MLEEYPETPSPLERRIRSQLSAIRLLQAVLPFSLANRMGRLARTRLRLPDGVESESVSADGVPCEWLIPQNSPEDQALLYLHGGGFVFGQTSQHLLMGAYLARKMDLRVLMVDYRVAPQHPFPAALDDCITAYRWLLSQRIPARNIVVAGDSAGGNLTLTTLMKLRENGEELPAAAACLSPVADLTKRGRPSDGFKDPLIPPRAAKYYNTSYVGDHDPHDPLISPVFGDWHGLPPLLIHAGENEMLRQDAVRVEELARLAGVDVRLEIYPRMWHVWQLFLALPQATRSLDDVAQFLKSHLKIKVP